ncbi:MAG TPA: hypothetical protein VKB89_17440, partial [Xanthobacteraceae bacterium]|nr:hypothetical protein [Xanthobacteraceae bacterium]
PTGERRLVTAHARRGHHENLAHEPEWSSLSARPIGPLSDQLLQHSGVDSARFGAPTSNFGSVHPPPAPYGEGERINLFRALAIGERVGNAGSDLFRSPMKRLFPCAASGSTQLNFRLAAFDCAM